jgi:hypothetical protein
MREKSNWNLQQLSFPLFLSDSYSAAVLFSASRDGMKLL